MRLNLGHRCVLALNTAYFAAAALAAVYVVAEAWHYGFWFTPAPLLLTLAACAFIGTVMVGLVHLMPRPLALFAFAGFMCVLAVGGVSGSFFASPPSLYAMLGFLVSITGAFGLALFIATSVPTVPPSFHWSPRTINLVRSAAILLPLPLFAFAGLQFAVLSNHCNAPLAVPAAVTFIKCERAVFGYKRADAIATGYERQEVSHGDYANARSYAKAAADNVDLQPLLCADRAAFARLRAARHYDLFQLCVLNGDGRSAQRELDWLSQQPNFHLFGAVKRGTIRH